MLLQGQVFYAIPCFPFSMCPRFILYMLHDIWVCVMWWLLVLGGVLFKKYSSTSFFNELIIKIWQYLAPRGCLQMEKCRELFAHQFIFADALEKWENEEKTKAKLHIKSLRDMRNNHHDYCINLCRRFFLFLLVLRKGVNFYYFC